MELVRFSLGARLLRAVGVALMLAFAVLPLLWVISIALRPGSQAIYPISILPTSLTLDNVWGVLFGPTGIGLGPYRNAAFYGLSSAVITAVASTLGGYALARYNMRAGLRVLISDEIEQRTRSEEYGVMADCTALILERDMRAAECIYAGQRPARHRQDAIARAGVDDEEIERDLLCFFRTQRVELPVPHVPCERRRPIVDCGRKPLDGRVQCAGFVRFEAVTQRRRSPKCVGRLAIDLATAFGRFVDDDDWQAMLRQRFSRPDAGGARADNRDGGISHLASVCRSPHACPR